MIMIASTAKAAEIILNSSMGNKDDCPTMMKKDAEVSGDRMKQNCDVSLERSYLKMASANEVLEIPVPVLLLKAQMTKDTGDPKIIRTRRKTKAKAKPTGLGCCTNNTKLRKVMKSRRPFICSYCYLVFCNFDRFQRHIKRHRVCRWHPKQQVHGTNVDRERSDQYSSSVVGGDDHEYSFALSAAANNELSLLRAQDDTDFSFFEPLSSADELALGKSDKYLCTTCRKFYASKSALIQHVRIHFNIRPFRCELCGKEFTQKGHLDGHMKTHTGLKPFQCSQCNKQFSRKSDLQRHVMIHTGDRQFKCNSCMMSFLSKDALNKHIGRKHSVIKPYQCTYCKKCYSRSDDFARHVRTVHEDPVKKLFSCGYCGKNFQSKDHLSKHEMIHTGEKPYACGVCGKAFARKYDVKRHANKFTCRPCQDSFTLERNNFACGLCGIAFARKYDLKRHVNKVDADSVK